MLHFLQPNKHLKATKMSDSTLEFWRVVQRKQFPELWRPLQDIKENCSWAQKKMTKRRFMFFSFCFISFLLFCCWCCCQCLIIVFMEGKCQVDFFFRCDVELTFTLFISVSLALTSDKQGWSLFWTILRSKLVFSQLKKI